MNLSLPDHKAVLGAAAVVTVDGSLSSSAHGFNAGTRCAIIEEKGTNSFHGKETWRLKSIDGKRSWNLFRDEFMVTEKHESPDYGPRPQFQPNTRARVLEKKYMDYFHQHTPGHIVVLQNTTTNPSLSWPFYQVDALDEETGVINYIPFDELEILEEQ